MRTRKSDWEGCLSVPGLRGMVPRFSHIRYTGFDQYGDPIDRTVDGFHARVVQHECDHLIGKLYPMRIRDLSQFGFTEVLFPGLDASATTELSQNGSPTGNGEAAGNYASRTLQVKLQRLQQLGFNRDLRLVVLQLRAVDQEGVFDALAQGGDLGQLDVDVVVGQHAGNQVEQARPGRWPRR